MRGKDRDHDKVIKAIRSWPQAADLADKDVKTIARLTHLTSVPEGWAFIRAGTPGDAAYLILAGSAHVLIGGKVVAELGPGDVTGEIALARGGLRTATVAATTKCTFLHIEKNDFEELKKASPAAYQLFIRYVEERVAALSG